MVDLIRVKSVNNDEILDEIVNITINHIISQNIYYHRKAFSFYYMLPNKERLINIDLSKKQKILYNIK